MLINRAGSFVLWASVISSQAFAGGSFSTLTYNVAGLLEPFSSSNPAKNTKEISCRIRGYTLVNVQEDFNYHADLYDACDDHNFRTATTGGMGIGSGLNTLSYLPFEDLQRVRWTACNGVDCLTPKGWSSVRVRLESGVYLSLYNLHSQAQTEEKDLDARRKNILQLLDAVEKLSPDEAVIVMGDTNTRYTRSGDNIGEFLNHGFKDVWIERIRDGAVPQRGDPGLTDCSIPTSRNCEVVDKVLYRNSRLLTLEPQTFLMDRDGFTNAKGEQLSDHPPISVTWNYTTSANWSASDLFGGPHGDPFSDLSAVQNAPIKSFQLRSGDRVDRIETILSNGTSLGHGGSGGKLQTLELAAGDSLEALELCSVEYSGRTRIGFLSLRTAAGKTLSGGKRTANCRVIEAPAGFKIAGFYGRSGDAVDKLGVYFTQE